MGVAIPFDPDGPSSSRAPAQSGSPGPPPVAGWKRSAGPARQWPQASRIRRSALEPSAAADGLGGHAPPTPAKPGDSLASPAPSSLARPPYLAPAPAWPPNPAILVVAPAPGPALPTPCLSPAGLAPPLPPPAGADRPRAAAESCPPPKRRRFTHTPAALGPLQAPPRALPALRVLLRSAACAFCLSCGAIFPLRAADEAVFLACPGWAPLLAPAALSAWRQFSALPDFHGLRPWSPAWAAVQRRGFLPPD